ncbi:hypothetical protein NLI96_g12415 [Meripilus lineatus]|uniref:Uncharacterized protein n=1 Tax=Meripilus lineatus TaxID=2056292 RepID=A0AAD5URB9_9APHY|nr:hypothetical protein NLI96_g12415 [Physisporinus lineatus]
MVGLLRIFERSRKPSPKSVSTPQTTDDLISTSHLEASIEEQIEKAWSEIRQAENNAKVLRKWKQLPLDDFEADLGRYVLTALHNLSRETQGLYTQTQTQDQHQAHHQKGESSTPGLIDYAPGSPLINENGLTGHCSSSNKSIEESSWASFAALQSNEVQQIKKFPELLWNHIRLYQVLKGMFCSGSHSPSGRKRPNGPNPSPSPRATSYDRETRKEGPNGIGRPRKTGEEEGSRESRPTMSTEEALGEVITIENVRRALGVEMGNSFGIWERPLTDESECLGFAVYPKPSFFNHSEYFVSIDGYGGCEDCHGEKRFY